jgi:hypothetical protein
MLGCVIARLSRIPLTRPLGFQPSAAVKCCSHTTGRFPKIQPSFPAHVLYRSSRFFFCFVSSPTKWFPSCGVAGGRGAASLNQQCGPRVTLIRCFPSGIHHIFLSMSGFALRFVRSISALIWIVGGQAIFALPFDGPCSRFRTTPLRNLFY